MRLNLPLFRLAEHVERIFDSHAAILRTQRKIPESTPFLPGHRPKSLLSFCANDFLSLKNLMPSCNDKVVSSTCRQPAFGPPDDSVLALEDGIGNYFGRHRALVTPSFDHAIWSVFSALVSSDDAILIDAFSRPIVRLAAQSSRAKHVISYRNCRLDDLERKLRDTAHCRLKIVVTDGFFELGSNIPPLVELGKLVSLYEPAMLVLLDANNFGLLGPEGKGLENHFGVEDLADVLVGGFEHTFGLPHCGFVSSSSTSLVASLRYSSIVYSRTPSLCPSTAHRALTALKFFAKPEIHSKLLSDLRQKAQYFRSALDLIGFHVMGDVPEHPAINVLLHHTPVKKNKYVVRRNRLDTAEYARILHKRLLKRGIELGCPLPPLVPFNGGRMRINISASHSYDDLDLCLQALEESAKGLRGVLKRR